MKIIHTIVAVVALALGAGLVTSPALARGHHGKHRHYPGLFVSAITGASFATGT